MEYINKIELCGYVGNVQFTDIQHTILARFSLAVQNTYKNTGGTAVSETIWFDCEAWENVVDLSKLQLGNVLHITGRVRERRYIDSYDTEKRVYTVVCQTIELVELEK